MTDNNLSRQVNAGPDERESIEIVERLHRRGLASTQSKVLAGRYGESITVGQKPKAAVRSLVWPSTPCEDIENLLAIGGMIKNPPGGSVVLQITPWVARASRRAQPWEPAGLPGEHRETGRRDSERPVGCDRRPDQVFQRRQAA